MNYWTKLSIDYAAKQSYLDDLFQVYPTIPEGMRDLNDIHWERIQTAFTERNNIELVRSLIALDLFPIKDSYIAYLRRDKDSIMRNTATVDRICGRLYEMGLDVIRARCTEPKETNRQIGPLFRRWLNAKSLGVEPVSLQEFIANEENAVLNAGDAGLMEFARKKFNYNRNKGLDLVARFNGKYVIGEAKFLSDNGGHQNAQFDDAISTLRAPVDNVTTIAILDGVLYIPGNGKMYKSLTNELKEYNIMSSLVLRDFLYQL